MRILLFFASALLLGEIYEIPKLSDSLSFIKSDSFVILDLDHTLVYIDGTPIENDLLYFFNQIKDRSERIAAFTGRPQHSSEFTRQKMAKLGIEFEPFELDNNNFNCENWWPCKHKAGIVYTGMGQKGPALKMVLNATKYDAQHIVSIDNKLSNLESLQNTADQIKIPFIGLLLNSNQLASF